jgi:hypothetical protein
MGHVDTFPTQAPAIATQGTFLGYAQVVATQTGVTTAAVDLTGLAVTVVVPAGRRIRITSQTLWQKITSAGYIITYIMEGATQLGEDISTVAAGSYIGHHASVIISPSAGSHTYKLRAACSGDTADMNAAATLPAFILVEDITNSAQPYPPASVPVGLLGYASISSTQAGITATNPGTAIAGLSVNVTVPAGRSLKVTVNGYAWNSTGNTQTNVRTMMDGVQIKEAADREDTANTANTIHSEVIVSPAAGAHVFSVNVSADSGGSVTFGGVPAFIMVEDITATPAPANSAPSSTLAYVEVTGSTQGSITTEVDITGLTTTVTVPAGRRIRLTAFTNFFSDTADRGGNIFIYEGSTRLVGAPAWGVTAAWGINLQASVVLSPSAGAHTYKVRVQHLGAGNGTVYSTTEGPSYLLVEDITAVSTYAINPQSIMPGSFLAGDFIIPGTLVVSGDGPIGAGWGSTDQMLSIVGRASNQYVTLAMTNQPGALGGTNLQWWWRADKTNKTHSFFAWDGTTIRTMFTHDFANGRTYLEDKPLRIRAFGDGAHGLQYTATLIDGPLLFGNSGAALGDANNGWDFRAMGNGDCYSRGKLIAATDVEAGSILRCGQARHITSNRFHWMGDGNDLHHNWGAGYQMYVDVTNVKTFVIPHPTDDERYLVHACLEGPEAGVIYRGQSQLVDGWVQIDLPAYFEALCAEEGRSVMLTCIADDPADEWCPVLHATYPKNGRFFVGLGSGMVINDQRFWWEVKAIRKDVPPVTVEPLTDTVDVLGTGPYTYAKEK